MAVLIDKDGKSKNYKSIMDEMPALKIKMDVLNELIETEKSGSKMWEDRVSPARDIALTITSTEVSKKHPAMDISHQDIKR